MKETPRTSIVTARVSPKLLKLLDRFRKTTGESRSALIQRWIAERLEEAA